MNPCFHVSKSRSDPEKGLAIYSLTSTVEFDPEIKLGILRDSVCDRYANTCMPINHEVH